MENEENKEIQFENITEQKAPEKKEHPSNLQVYNIVTSRDPSWQSIIYDLIASEQLDPWNIDIAVLCRGYFEKIKQLEENNFQISSKMLLAASLLLRIKSEVLLNVYIREIDNILFKKEEQINKIIERIELDENEIPILSPKTPMPRFKKVTLQELIDALDTAIKTESRRINKEIEKKQAERLSYVDIPKFKRINIKDRIRHFYAKILSGFKSKKGEIRLPYSHFTGNSKEEKIACFLPMLYLSNHGKIWLEQEKHFDEIWLYMYEKFKEAFPDFEKSLLDSEENQKSEFSEDIPEHMIENFDDKEESEEDKREKAQNKVTGDIYEPSSVTEAEKLKRAEEINKDFENPIGDLISGEIR